MKNKLLAYFGHHRCATTWIKDILRQLCRDMNLGFANVNRPQMFNNALDSFVMENGIDLLSYTNADYSFVQDLDDFLGFHVIRDPRDIVVSAYFSHLYSHSTTSWPALVEHRRKLRQVPKDEGLFLEIDFRRKQFDHMYQWNYSQDNVLELKMEELIASPYKKMLDVLSYLQIVKDEYGPQDPALFWFARLINRIHSKAGGFFPFHITLRSIPAENLLGYLYKNRFERKARGRKPGEENPKSHYRKGIAGDWVNHFNAEHREFFKSNYNDLLQKLGYEATSEW